MQLTEWWCSVLHEDDGMVKNLLHTQGDARQCLTCV